MRLPTNLPILPLPSLSFFSFPTFPLCPTARTWYNTHCKATALATRLQKKDSPMPSTALEEDLKQLDAAQLDAVTLFVHSLLSRKSPPPPSSTPATAKYDFSDLIGKVRFPVDPVAYQRSIRDEW